MLRALIALLVLAGPALAGTEAADRRAAAAGADLAACLAEFPADGLDIFTPVSACAFAGEQECRAAETGPEAEIECLLAVNQAWFEATDRWGGALIEGGRLGRADFDGIVGNALMEGDLHCDVMTGAVEDDRMALAMRLACQIRAAARIGVWFRYLAATLD